MIYFTNTVVEKFCLPIFLLTKLLFLAPGKKVKKKPVIKMSTTKTVSY